MTVSVTDVLKNCRICDGMTKLQIDQLVADTRCRLQTYEKGEYIFHEGDTPEKLYILLSGRVMISSDTLSGRQLLITEINQPGDMFGEVYLFLSRMRYDMQASAVMRSELLSVNAAFFGKDQTAGEPVYQLLQYNMMCIFAEKAYMMNRKLKVLGSGSIREKLVSFLYERQSEDGSIAANMSREDMARYLNIQRPSLSRELSRMQQEGILRIAGRQIIIEDQIVFESYL